MKQETTPSGTLVGRLQRAITIIEDTILGLVLTAMIVISATQIVLRNLFESGLLWADPLLRVMVLWVGLLGAIVATRMDKQITVDVLSRLLPARAAAAVRVITDLFTALVAGALAWHAARLVLDDMAFGTEAFSGIPAWVCEIILPVAFSVIALEYLVHAAVHLWRSTTGRGLP
jgi:TRAP-type C4-dicarboxylate transport system permease small subunit